MQCYISFFVSFVLMCSTHVGHTQLHGHQNLKEKKKVLKAWQKLLIG